MESSEDQDLCDYGRVLVEPIEFVDLRDIARGKHGSHRGSPERDIPRKTSRNVSSKQDPPNNCLQIALQQNVPSPKDSSSLYRESFPNPEQVTRTPSKDEVLSVVIQKLTELVENSEKQEHRGMSSNQWAK